MQCLARILVLLAAAEAAGDAVAVASDGGALRRGRRLQDPSDGGSGDDSEAEIERLRQQLLEERNRAEIADVATEAALQNATLQAQKRREAEEALAKASPTLQAARDAAAAAGRRADELEAELKTSEAAAAKAKAEAAEAAKTAEAAQDQAAASAAQAAAAAARHANRTAEKRLAHEREEPAQPQGPSVVDGLRALSFQTSLAVLSLLFGLLSILDAAGFMQVSLVALCAVVCGSLMWQTFLRDAAGQPGGGLGGGSTGVVAGLLGVEAGVVVGGAAVVGMDGLGALAGAALGAVLGGQLRSVASGDLHGGTDWACWYGAWCAAGFFGVFFGGRHGRAVVGALLGGLFAASFACFCVSSVDNGPSTWWDCVLAVLFPGGGELSGADRMTVAGVWAVVALAGLARHATAGDDEDEHVPFAGVLRLCGLLGSSDSPKGEGFRQPLLDSGDSRMHMPAPMQQQQQQYRPPPGGPPSGPSPRAAPGGSPRKPPQRPGAPAPKSSGGSGMFKTMKGMMKGVKGGMAGSPRS